MFNTKGFDKKEMVALINSAEEFKQACDVHLEAGNEDLEDYFYNMYYEKFEAIRAMLINVGIESKTAHKMAGKQRREILELCSR